MSHAVDVASPIPLYYQIAHLLRSRIVAGRHPAGSRLGTEHELAATFGVSRITVRQALAVLDERGLISRRRGQGTFVRVDVPAESPVELHGFLDDIILHADEAGTVEVDRETVPAEGVVAASLELPPGTDVVRFDRLRADGAGPRAWVVNYVPVDVADRIEDVWGQQSLLLRIDSQPGLRLASGYETIEAAVADEATAGRLAVAPGAAVLEVERIVRVATGRPIEYVRVRYPGARQRFAVRLTRVERVVG